MGDLREKLRTLVMMACSDLLPQSDQRPCPVDCVKLRFSCSPLRNNYMLLHHPRSQEHLFLVTHEMQL